jgi:hypothetical protein
VRIESLLYAPLLIAAVPDPRELVLQSSMRDATEVALRRNYTYLQHSESRHVDGSGRIKSVEHKTHEVMVLYGRPYRRLVALDGKPLDARDQAKEEEKMERELSRRRRETGRDRARREADERKSLEEEREFRREIADAFTFTHAGEEKVSGKAAWVLDAQPRPGYKPKTSRGRILPKLRGRLWITQDDRRWVKVEAEVIDTISFGWVVARLTPGARMSFEAIRVGDAAAPGALWMPSRAAIRGNARLGLVKKLHIDQVVWWENYRRFTADSKVVESELVQ